MAETFLHGVEVLEIDSGSRPIQTVSSAVIGIVGTAPNADASVFPLNTPVLIAGSRLEAAKLEVGTGASDGTLPSAIDSILDQAGAVIVVVRVEPGTTEAETLAHVVGGVDAATGNYTGVHAFKAAESVLGVSPRILLASGFTHQKPVSPTNANVKLANPVVSEMIGIAEQLRAVIIADGPNTTDEAAQTYAGDFGSSRVYMVDPGVLKLGSTGDVVEAYSSACVAGLIAKSDNERGFWYSPSNQTVNGIIGTKRPVDFALGSSTCRANVLNGQNVATIIHQNGYRLWGNRTLGATADPKWMFLSVRRTADIINDSLLRAHLWAVDRNITKTYIEDVTEGVNAYLRHLTTIGAILGGTCWADPALNTADQIAQGKIYFDFDFTPPYPAEHITFRSQLTNGYLSSLFD